MNPSNLAPKVHTHTASDITNLLDTIYPVGSIYLTISTNPLNPSGSSPASWLGGKWKLLPADKALWTASGGAGTPIDAGLPNIKGYVRIGSAKVDVVGLLKEEGALSVKDYGDDRNVYSGGVNAKQFAGVEFNAASGEMHNSSYSNKIYGKSDTVQPPAYKVYAWRRES